MYERSGLGFAYTDPKTGARIWKLGNHSEASLKAELLNGRPAATAPVRKAATTNADADLDALFTELEA